MLRPAVSPPVVAPAPPPVSPAVKFLCTPWMAAKRAVLRRRLGKAVFERVLRRPFIIWPGVFNPVVFRTGRFLAEFVARTPLLEIDVEPKTALDVGTGCGVMAVFAALRGYRVTAVDVVPEAVSCARANAILNRVEIELLVGDLFAPVAGRQFDVILASLPKYRGTPNTADAQSWRSVFDRSWRNPDVIDRFAEGLPALLKPGGCALFVLTSHGDCDGMLNGLAKAGLEVERVLWRHFGVETMAIYAARLPTSRAISVAGSS